MPLPPGPRTPPLWQTYRFVSDPGPYTRALQEKYGDVVRIHGLAGPGVYVFESDIAREVFSARPELYDTPPMLGSLFGETSVVAVAGAPHKKLRKLLNPGFHGTQVKSFLAGMQRAIRGHLGSLAAAAASGETIVVYDFAQDISLDVIIETVFGASSIDRAAARDVVLGVISTLSPAIMGGTTFHKPWFPPYRRYARNRARFYAWVDTLIRDRRARGESARRDDIGDDILGVMLSVRYDDGSAMDEAEIRDQLLTLLLAGHESTAITMSWCVYHLLRTPDAMARLRAEIDALGPQPSAEDITCLRYLGAVVSETLRMKPPVTNVVRICREPLTLGGKWHVPAGYAVVVIMLAILRDPRVFPEPERFRPERFIEKKHGPSEFVPFGGGGRRCLGAAFAESEIALAVAEIASRWDLVLEGDAPVKAVRRNLTMGPENGVRVRVKGARKVKRAEDEARA